VADDPKAKPGVGFTREGAARVAAVTRFVERKYRLPPPPRGRYPVGSGGGSLLRGILTTALTARSGSTPGTGSFSFRTFDGTTAATATATMTVRNDYLTAIATGKVIWVQYADGVYWLVVGDC
jgi:hypothetical protein